MENKSSLTFSFCGGYEVNALSLSQAINSLVELATVVAEKEFPGVEFRMSVKAITPGSLKFDFVADAVIAAQTLISPPVIEYAANMIDIMSASFSVKKFLKGINPKGITRADEKLIITNADGQTLEIPKSAGVYFIDNRVDKSITNIIHAAKASDGATGISIDGRQRVEIRREEFEACATELNIDEMTVTEQNNLVYVRHNEVLFVRQADFSGELKWKFTGDQNITAAVMDEAFREKVKEGLVVISAKTYIIADVQVKISLTPEGTPDNSKPAYEVLKVHSVHTAGEGQTKLDI